MYSGPVPINGTPALSLQLVCGVGPKDKAVIHVVISALPMTMVRLVYILYMRLKCD